MFAGIVQLTLKPWSKRGYTLSTGHEVFRKTKKPTRSAGQVSVIGRDGREGMGISLGTRRENAGAYDRKEFADAMERAEKHREGKPGGHSPEVTNSTIDVVLVPSAARQSIAIIDDLIGGPVAVMRWLQGLEPRTIKNYSRIRCDSGPESWTAKHAFSRAAQNLRIGDRLCYPIKLLESYPRRSLP